MEIGIGLPNAVRGVDRNGTVEWARRAEAAGFASLGTIDRLVFPNYESMISLAAAAAVTERIRLVTDILILPLRRNTALFAKQAATLDDLSGGRLVLGLAPGGREDDYEVSGTDFGARGRTFDRQLEELGPLWRGQSGVGPAPANGERPTLLIGGQSDKDIARVARHADEVDLPEGRELVREGAFAYELFAIEEGTAEVRHGDQPINTLGPGDFFGEIAVMSSGRRTATVVTTSPMTAVVMTASDFRALSRDLPDVVEKIRAAIEERTRDVAS